MSVQILYGTVIRHDIEFIVREYHRKERVVLLCSVVGTVRTLADIPYPACSSATVMSVCDVKAGDGSKQLSKFFNNPFFGNYPQSMRNAIVSRKIILGGSCRDPLDELVDLRIMSESVENRLVIRIQNIDMPYPVLFLVRSGQFMFFDHTALIVIHIRTGDKTGLGNIAHDLPVHVIVLLRILNQHTVGYEFEQVLMAFKINRLGVDIDSAVQVDLRSRYPEKAVRIARSH